MGLAACIRLAGAEQPPARGLERVEGLDGFGEDVYRWEDEAEMTGGPGRGWRRGAGRRAKSIRARGCPPPKREQLPALRCRWHTCHSKRLSILSDSSGPWL